LAEEALVIFKLIRYGILVISLLLANKGHAMESSEAMNLIEGWGEALRDRTSIGALKVDGKGGFKTKSKGAFFRYDAQKKSLLVSGLIGYNMKTFFREFPHKWAKLHRVAEREKVTLCEGTFELYQEQLFEYEPDVVLLTKTFAGRPPETTQFVREIRWLLAGAIHWNLQRFNAVMVKPDEELKVSGAKIVASWPKRSW
jgi:hypothetical protein